MTTTSKESSSPKVYGYLPDDNPPLGAMLSLSFQQFLTMFPATVMSRLAPACFNDPGQLYCPAGVGIVQVGIVLTAVFKILVGLLIMRIGKSALDRGLAPSCSLLIYRAGA